MEEKQIGLNKSPNCIKRTEALMEELKKTTAESYGTFGAQKNSSNFSH
jgi:hypothetical protein